jgi:hypothetical protein
MVNLGSVSPLKTRKPCSDRRSIKKSSSYDVMDDLTWNIWPTDDPVRVTEILDQACATFTKNYYEYS